MSQKLYQFKFDDILNGNDGAVICRSRDRFIVRGFDVENMRLLQKLRKKSNVSSLDMFSPEKVTQLLSVGLISDDVDLKIESSQSKRFELSADVVRHIATSIFPLGTGKGLFFLIILSLVALTLLPIHLLHGSMSLTVWFAQAKFSDILISSIVLFICVHELGHATACVVNTGTVGAIRFRSYRGSPALAIDVSSIVFTDRRGQAMIALAGVIFQLAISTCILLFPLPQSIEWGCRLSLFAALFSLSPLPKTDGYWFLCDLIGRQLSPRLFFPSNLVDLVYSLLTFITFIFGIYSLLIEVKALFFIGIHELDIDFLRGSLFLLLSIYASFVGSIFSWKMCQLFLFGKEK